MNDTATASESDNVNDRSPAGHRDDHGHDGWETVRHDVSMIAPSAAGPDRKRQEILWTAALCLCLRRYGAPPSAALTVMEVQGGNGLREKRRINLTFADVMGSRDWLKSVGEFSADDSAIRTRIESSPDQVPPIAWRSTLMVNSDVTASSRDTVDSDERWFAVAVSTAGVSLSAARNQHRLNDNFPLVQMLRHWEQLASGILQTPQLPVGRLPVLTQQENDALTPPEKPAETIANPRFGFELFDDQVALTPQAPAVSDGNETLTYHELWLRTNRLAHFLKSRGVGPETIVGVCLERSIDLVVAVIGLQKAGGGHLPIDPAYPRKRLENLIRDSCVAFIITTSGFSPRLPPGEYVAVLLDQDAALISTMPADTCVHGLQPGNMSFVFYTSGSTGQPKGVIMEHTVRAPFDRTRTTPDMLAPGEKVLLKSAVGFTLIIREIFWPLHFGGHLVVVPQGSDGDSAYLVRALREQNVVGANFVPSMLALLVDEPEFNQCTSLRLVYTVGESLSVELQRQLFARLPGVRLFVFYGCTEAPAATFRECRPDEDFGNRVVIGKPMANKSIVLLDRTFMPVPQGVTGEIHTGGAISRGYLHRPDLTADRFIPNPFSTRPGDRFYRTGDLARVLPDGNLEYLGRSDSQVQVRGVRVELGEIEAVISTHPAVKEALVTADSRQVGPTRLIAYFTEKRGSRASVADLRSLLRGQLPEYMVPSTFMRLDAFPLNANGKVDRRNLPEPIVDRAGSCLKNVSPRTEVEIRLLGLWVRLLNTDSLGVTDRFFDAGGDSILATRLLASVKREFQVIVSLPEFYRQPTIEAMARLIGGEAAGTDLKVVIPISMSGTRRPVFMANLYPHLTRFFGPAQPYFGMKQHWLDARFDFNHDIPAIMREFLREVVTIQPAGPYTLAGFSMGGIFALELARQLEDAGHEVGCLYLLDPTLPSKIDGSRTRSHVPAPTPGSRRPQPWERIERHRSRLRNLSLKAQLRYFWNRRRVPFQLAYRYTIQQVLIALGLCFNAVGRDVPFSLRYIVAEHYYRRILKSYEPKPLRSRGKVFLINGRTATKVATLDRLFPAGVEKEFLDTCNHLEVLEEPHLSRWMRELLRDLGGDSNALPTTRSSRGEASTDTRSTEADEPDDTRIFRVVVNTVGQYSVWPMENNPPAGWAATGFQGNRASCLVHIADTWAEQLPIPQK